MSHGPVGLAGLPAVGGRESDRSDRERRDDGGEGENARGHESVVGSTQRGLYPESRY